MHDLQHSAAIKAGHHTDGGLLPVPSPITIITPREPPYHYTLKHPDLIYDRKPSPAHHHHPEIRQSLLSAPVAVAGVDAHVRVNGGRGAHKIGGLPVRGGRGMKGAQRRNSTAAAAGVSTLVQSALIGNDPLHDAATIGGIVAADGGGGIRKKTGGAAAVVVVVVAIILSTINRGLFY